jgi:hypothetical protein
MFTGARVSDHSLLEAHAWVDTGLAVNDKNFEHSGFATLIRIEAGAVDR